MRYQVKRFRYIQIIIIIFIAHASTQEPCGHSLTIVAIAVCLRKPNCATLILSYPKSICDRACENQSCERKLHLVRYS